MMLSQNPILPRVIPFALYILFLALDDALKPLLHGMQVDEKWLYLLRALATSCVLIYYWRDFNELTERPTLTQWFVGLLVGLFVFAIWILPYPTWATLGQDATHFNPYQDVSAQVALFWISTRIMGAALVVPIMEELFWRSFLMRWLDNKEFLNISPKTVSFFALIGSSGLFALEHHLWLAGFFAGLCYAFLYRHYQNLWVPIFAHAVTNGVLGVWVVQTSQWQYW
jgi:uncharacterized protein